MNPRDPPDLLVLSEDSSHNETMLEMKTDEEWYSRQSSTDYIGRMVSHEYLSLIFEYLTDQWSNLLEVSISHVRLLVRDTSDSERQQQP